MDLLDGEEGYSLISYDLIEGERREFSRHYGKIKPGSMFHKTLTEGPQLILRKPEDGGRRPICGPSVTNLTRARRCSLFRFARAKKTSA